MQKWRDCEALIKLLFRAQPDTSRYHLGKVSMTTLGQECIGIIGLFYLPLPHGCFYMSYTMSYTTAPIHSFPSLC